MNLLFKSVQLFTDVFKQLNQNDIARLHEKKEQYTQLLLHKQYSFRSSVILLFSSRFAKIFDF